MGTVHVARTRSMLNKVANRQIAKAQRKAAEPIVMRISCTICDCATLIDVNMRGQVASVSLRSSVCEHFGTIGLMITRYPAIPLRN